MGWCSGTAIFDAFCEGLFGSCDTKQELLEYMIEELEGQDWDCQQDSAHWTHPMVQQAFRKLHPDWFEEEEV